MLFNHHDNNNLVALFHKDDGRLQPFPGIYQSTLSDLIFERIKAREFSLKSFLRLVPSVYLVSHRLNPKVFMNVNEMKDLSF